jgi:hypothetical protein
MIKQHNTSLKYLQDLNPKSATIDDLFNIAVATLKGQQNVYSATYILKGNSIYI